MRVMLDTNIWSRLADQALQYPFTRLVRKKDLEIVVPPATLLELARNPDREARKASVGLVCRKTWRRLKTEAESEAKELVAEIKRLRPDWILTHPNYDIVHHLERFWLREIWDVASTHARLLFLADEQTKSAIERNSILNLQRVQQGQWREEGIFRSLEEIQKDLRASGAKPLPDQQHIRQAQAWGWEPGSLVERWRWETQVVFWDALTQAPIRASFTGEHTTYADWVGAYVDLSVIRANHRNFGHMLLYEVLEERMPRAWLRWAVHFAQHATRLGSGNPVDVQLASYLVEADLFITNDKRLARIIETVRPSALTPCAAAVYADIWAADGNTVNAIDIVT
jgi:hypothetical protein